MAHFLSSDQILGVLHGFNPWWDAPAPQPFTFRRIAYGLCREYLDHPSLHRAVMLSGPRRVGKSVILQQIARAKVAEGIPPRSILYLSLEHPFLKVLSLPEIIKIYHANIHPSGEQTTLLLDEIQYAQDWELHLKVLVDHQTNYRVLATGSAALSTRHRLSESGVGRWVTVPIPTLSFFEFIRIRGEGPDDGIQVSPEALFRLSTADRLGLAAHLRPLMPLFHRYLLLGGFPETAKLDDLPTAQRLLREDVVDGVLKRDMTALYGVRNIAELERLFIYLCLHTGGIFQAKTCADQLEISPTTVSKHLDYLELAHLVYRVNPYALSGKLVLKGRPKVHLVDAAIRNAVLLRGTVLLQDPTELGLVVESAITRHILAFYHPSAAEVTYWRDPKSGKEVDIILRVGQETVPFEVKYRDPANLGSKDGIVDFCRKESIARAYFITRAEPDFGPHPVADSSTAFMKVPAHIFAFLAGQTEMSGQGI
jgi:predicted AAA+ superfamily ATPase